MGEDCQGHEHGGSAGLICYFSGPMHFFLMIGVMFVFSLMYFFASQAFKTLALFSIGD